MSKDNYVAVALVFNKNNFKELVPRSCIVKVEDGDTDFTLYGKAEAYCQEVCELRDEIKGCLVVGRFMRGITLSNSNLALQEVRKIALREREWRLADSECSVPEVRESLDMLSCEIDEVVKGTYHD